MFAVDGFTILSIAVKSLASLASLVAAGSVLALIGLKGLDGDTVRAVRRFGLASALVAGVTSLMLVPVRASFLAGGSWAGSIDPWLVGMVADGPLGDSLAVRLAGLAMTAFLFVDRKVTRAAAGLGAVLVCTSFALRGHTLTEPRLVLAALVTLHLFGIVFWIGALAALHRLARHAEPTHLGAVAGEFGRKALRVVAGLAVAGAVLLILLTGNPLDALATPYGRLFAFKLSIFVLLLGLAAFNKLRLTPALLSGDATAGVRLTRSIRLEIAAVIAILVTTATLTTIASPGNPDRAEAASGSVTAGAVTTVRPAPFGHRPASGS